MSDSADRIGLYPQTGDSRGKIALLWRGNPAAAEKPTAQDNRLHLLFKAFADLNVAAEPIVYSDEIIRAVRERLLQCDGVLVWVDPVRKDGNRAKLDPILRDVASHGVFVSSHPDLILKMGTKEVLYRTRHMSWGTDTRHYTTLEQFRCELPQCVRRRRSNSRRKSLQRRSDESY